ncbi:MAG: Clp protease N-terminal domain-containing protein, partial [Pseudomonadales bacterium]
MRIDRFTSRLQEALSDAQSIAVGKDHNYITPAHLVQALLQQQGGSTRPLLSQMGVDVGKFGEELEHLVTSLPVVKDNYGDVQMSPELGRLLNLADKLAQERKDEFISSELVLLAAISDRGEL